jgi:hypothetical protein
MVVVDSCFIHIMVVDAFSVTDILALLAVRYVSYQKAGKPTGLVHPAGDVVGLHTICLGAWCRFHQISEAATMSMGVGTTASPTRRRAARQHPTISQQA